MAFGKCYSCKGKHGTGALAGVIWNKRTIWLCSHIDPEVDCFTKFQKKHRLRLIDRADGQRQFLRRK